MRLRQGNPLATSAVWIPHWGYVQAFGSFWIPNRGYTQVSGVRGYSRVFGVPNWGYTRSQTGDCASCESKLSQCEGSPKGVSFCAAGI